MVDSSKAWEDQHSAEGVTLQKRLVLATVAGCLLLGSLSVAASAHEPCSTSYAKAQEHKYDYPNEWNDSNKAGIDRAAANISNNSPYYFTKVSATEAEFRWGDYGSSDTSLAGYTDRTIFCTAAYIDIIALYYNFAHFQGTHSGDEKQCIAIHEFGHGMGVEHNSLTSIEYQPHSTRCHSWLIKTLQPHDVGDIDFKY